MCVWERERDFLGPFHFHLRNVLLINFSLATGYFAAVGGEDWAGGLGCGACARLTYRGRSVVVKVVDR